MMRLRAARAEDFAELQEIERAAGQLFRAVGMVEIAEDEPFTFEELEGYQQGGRAWVAVDPADVPVGYLLADPVDGNVHIEQVSVHPRWARRGIGLLLIDGLARDSAAAGVPALTLTTFADVPWNLPYYLRCGFTVIDDESLTPGLRAIREHEGARGLDRWPRVCMRRELRPG